MNAPKINHASVSVSYYPSLESADISACVIRGDKVNHYFDITKSSTTRVFRVIMRLVELYPEKDFSQDGIPF